MEVKVGGGICLVVVLFLFYDWKEVVKMFVIVIDEEEVESESLINFK